MGFLRTSDGQELYWEESGNPRGIPALAVHGGPGSGCSPWWRRLFDPERYRVVLFDQRGCGRSRRHASDPAVSLEANTTDHLLRDIEALRGHLAIDRWLLVGGSWGSALALAYAVANPARVAGAVLFGIATGRREEWDWLFRGGLARFFPAEWERLVAALPPSERHGDIPAAFARRLAHRDPDVRTAAAHAWCLWESATPDWPPREGLAPRFADPAFAYAFARLVTHYAAHDGWFDDTELLRGAATLGHIPATLINGRYDFQSPLANAWALHRAWPGSELVVVDDAGHAASEPALTAAIIAATDRFAANQEAQ
ncbi:MAG: prolyl aminopeptidase [Dehalococcoidia bacterium]